MPVFNSKLSLLVDQAVLGSERTTGRTRRLWLCLLGLLLKWAGR